VTNVGLFFREGYFNRACPLMIFTRQLHVRFVDGEGFSVFCIDFKDFFRVISHGS